jgi:hypothetical protein
MDDPAMYADLLPPPIAKPTSLAAAAVAEDDPPIKKPRAKAAAAADKPKAPRKPRAPKKVAPPTPPKASRADRLKTKRSGPPKSEYIRDEASDSDAMGTDDGEDDSPNEYDLEDSFIDDTSPRDSDDEDEDRHPPGVQTGDRNVRQQWADFDSDKEMRALKKELKLQKMRAKLSAAANKTSVAMQTLPASASPAAIALPTPISSASAAPSPSRAASNPSFAEQLANFARNVPPAPQATSTETLGAACSCGTAWKFGTASKGKDQGRAFAACPNNAWDGQQRRYTGGCKRFIWLDSLHA